MDLLILLIELACDMDDTRFVITGKRSLATRVLIVAIPCVN